MGKEVSIYKMVSKMTPKLEQATGSKAQRKVGNGGGEWSGSNDSGRYQVAGEEFGKGVCTNKVSAKGRGERDAKGAGKLGQGGELLCRLGGKEIRVKDEKGIWGSRG
jgi:hypothetical protein